jgi:hypothetical protein
MPRQIGIDGLALQQTYNRVGELTNINSERFNREVFLKVRHTAYCVSNDTEGRGKNPNEIWDITKAYFALGFCGGVYVGICSGPMEIPKHEPHDDLNLGSYTDLIIKTLTIFNRVRYAGKPSPEWFGKHRHLFKDLAECMSRNVLGKEISI